MKYVLVLGAKSDIAKALAEVYANHDYHLILAGRDIDSLIDFSIYLKTKYQISVELVEFDVLEIESHGSFIARLTSKPFGIICCVGYLGDQEKAQENPEEVMKIIQTNYVGCVSILEQCAASLQKVQEGFIIAISSVAGERGRKSNYFYGSAKAGFTQYLSGLRAQLRTKGVHVLTVKPGFVYTKMTAHLNLPKPLSIHPEKLAKRVYKAQKRSENVVYVQWVWRYIMWIIRSIPEFIFKKMNL